MALSQDHSFVIACRCPVRDVEIVTISEQRAPFSIETSVHTGTQLTLQRLKFTSGNTVIQFGFR